MTGGVCEVAVRQLGVVVHEPGRRPYRPLALLAVDLESDVVVHHEAYPPDTPAATLARQLARRFAELGYRPSRVCCRDADLAWALAQVLAPLGTRVMRVTRLVVADRILDAVDGRLTSGRDPWGYWSELESSYPDVRGLMADAARFYAEAPWRFLDDDQLVVMTFDGRRRYLSILGSAGETYGLAVFMSRRGAERVLNARGVPPRRFPDTVSVVYDDGRDLPPRLRERIRRRYALAGPRAYPTFMRTHDGKVGTPYPPDLRLLRAALQAVPRFVHHLRSLAEAVGSNGRARHGTGPAAGVPALQAPNGYTVAIRLEDGTREVTLALPGEG